LRIFESAQNVLVRPLYPVDLFINEKNFNGCDAAAIFSRQSRIGSIFLTRFQPQTSLRNLRKLDCHANRRPLRIKSRAAFRWKALFSYQQRMISATNR
jgi:hypothetical protein